VVIFVGMGCFQNSQNKTSNPELQIMQRAGSYVERGQYVEARDIYTQFIEKFPDHPYIDDAAYRLSYLHLIDEEENPFFSYQNAQILFENFIENYPNSRYIIVYKNWLNLLNSVPNSSEDPAVSPFRDQLNSFEINQFKIELNCGQT
jgi:outer membrane protein assembly factor BamD (BamD/ComL family)